MTTFESTSSRTTSASMGPQGAHEAPAGPLAGWHAVSLAANVPGPAATQWLRREGMRVTKIEPPAGDMLAGAAPSLHAELAVGIARCTLDLRSPAGQQQLHTLLDGADVLVTSHRPAALARLGITADALAARHPRLCWVEIVGDLGAPETPGHDLTYQMQADLLAPPALPRTLLADLVGAEHAARAALALLIGRERGRPERHRRVGLRQAADAMTAPLRHGLTAPGGWLGGGTAAYGVYPLADGGWAAVAALEPHFAERLAQVLAGRELGAMLGAMDVAACEAMAAAHDLPIHAMPADGQHR